MAATLYCSNLKEGLCEIDEKHESCAHCGDCPDCTNETNEAEVIETNRLVALLIKNNIDPNQGLDHEMYDINDKDYSKVTS
tara:strand:+ start:1482 stop:1724 length:243 start_codon:yes stop_codon:yes gene_type:complete